jgi:hypothetical protein
VTRIAFAVLLAFFAGQTLTAPALAALEVCAEACPDDGPDGRCGSECFDCSCCSHAPRPIAVSDGGFLPRAPSRRIAASEAPSVPSSQPEDVFHVPRPASSPTRT